MYTQHLSHARASSHDETHITTGKSWRQSILMAARGNTYYTSTGNIYHKPHVRAPFYGNS